MTQELLFCWQSCVVSDVLPKGMLHFHFVSRWLTFLAHTSMSNFFISERRLEKYCKPEGWGQFIDTPNKYNLHLIFIYTADTKQ